MDTSTADPYHFTPDVLKLAIDALTHINRGKQDVLVWFRSAGVPQKLLITWQEKLRSNRGEVHKAEIARDILCKLNEGGDGYLRLRREIVKRLVETEDFSTCWPDDVLPAQGLIARLRSSVDAKDSFTRMKLEFENASKAQRLSRDAELQKRQAKLSSLREMHRSLTSLVTASVQPQQRGREFETELTHLFQLSEIQIREPFKTENEQIDGAVHFDGHTYLVEARWWSKPLEHKDVADLFVKISTRPPGTRGIYISASRFTDGCVEECAATRMPVIFVTLEDILLCLESETELLDMLLKKYQRYVTEKRILVGFRELS